MALNKNTADNLKEPERVSIPVDTDVRICEKSSERDNENNKCLRGYIYSSSDILMVYSKKELDEDDFKVCFEYCPMCGRKF